VSRPMLLNGMGLSALAKPIPFFNLEDDSDRVLVLVQLNGGNDGLNTLVPIDQYDNLRRARPDLIIPQNRLIKLTDQLGLHPQMRGVESLYLEGKLGLVQSVGYPNQNRSHFRSMEIWSSASSANEYLTTGWMGRYLDHQFPGFPENYPNARYPDPFAITMGFSVSETCQGQASNISVALNNPFSLRQIPEGIAGDEGGGYYREELAYIRNTIQQTNRYGERITVAAQRGRNRSDYPNTELARQLKNVALLISGGLRTKVYIVSLGGFDTHAAQVESGDPLSGRHAGLLNTLSAAMRAFHDDLRAQKLEEQVLGMTFSEFGRQIRSNGSAGTDHGAAAPLLLFGSCAKSGILGRNPEIAREVEPQEGVPMQYDFRDVYGSVLMDWFDFPEADVRALLYPQFRRLPIIGCGALSTSVDPWPEESVALLGFPNPFEDKATVRFQSTGEWVRLSVFDALGGEIRVLIDGRLPAGEHQVIFDAQGLPAGHYFVHLRSDDGRQTARIVKAGG
jgi:uncharacterized protein (DUF1501 family)